MLKPSPQLMRLVCNQMYSQLKMVQITQATMRTLARTKLQQCQCMATQASLWKKTQVCVGKHMESCAAPWTRLACLMVYHVLHQAWISLTSLAGSLLLRLFAVS